MSEPGLSPTETEELMDKYSDLDNQCRLIGGYDAQNRAASILRGPGLGEEKLDQSVATLSGGEKTRTVIANPWRWGQSS
jgi:ATP-binding cassette subfamily F protein 3